MSKATLKHIFFGIILLFLFHFETNEIAGIKISHLWKGLALLFILSRLFVNKFKLFIYGPYILIAVLMLLHIDIYTNVSTSIFNFIITLFIPVIGIYALKFNSKQLKLPWSKKLLVD